MHVAANNSNSKRLQLHSIRATGMKKKIIQNWCVCVCVPSKRRCLWRARVWSNVERKKSHRAKHTKYNIYTNEVKQAFVQLENTQYSFIADVFRVSIRVRCDNIFWPLFCWSIAASIPRFTERSVVYLLLIDLSNWFHFRFSLEIWKIIRFFAVFFRNTTQNLCFCNTLKINNLFRFSTFVTVFTVWHVDLFLVLLCTHTLQIVSAG